MGTARDEEKARRSKGKKFNDGEGTRGCAAVSYVTCLRKLVAVHDVSDFRPSFVRFLRAAGSQLLRHPFSQRSKDICLDWRASGSLCILARMHLTTRTLCGKRALESAGKLVGIFYSRQLHVNISYIRDQFHRSVRSEEQRKRISSYVCLLASI